MRIGLGTAQFGMDYGITAGTQVRPQEVGKILAVARRAGITTLDTAPAYGGSERVIAKLDPDEYFDVITKTPKHCTVEEFLYAFWNSLAFLGPIYGLLLHSPRDTHLWGEMRKLKEEGLVEKIGVSIYEGNEIPNFPVDIIQVPFNALDRRLIYGGHLERLKEQGTEIHARSVFLQGLLLEHPSRFPPHLAPLAEVVDEMQKTFAEQGLSPMEGALAAVLQCPYIDLALVGVTRAMELREIIGAARNVEGVRVKADFTVPPNHINPARWAELVH